MINDSCFEVPFKNGKYNAAVSVELLHHFTEELEKEYFENLQRLKKEENITDDEFYHYDTPLTVKHEIRILKEAGFAEVNILKNWSATYALRAER